MKRLTICCVLPTEGRVELLRAALSDLLCQTFKDYVIVVVDDGQDSTSEFIKNIGSTKIFYIRTPPMSLGAKYNLGAKLFPADYFFSANDDDFYPHDRFEKQLSILGKKRATCLKYVSYLRRDGKVYLFKTKAGRMAHGSTFACDYDFLVGIGGWNEYEKALDGELGDRIVSNGGTFEYTEDALDDKNYWKQFLCLQHNSNMWEREFDKPPWEYLCDLREYIDMSSKDWLSITYFKKAMEAVNE